MHPYKATTAFLVLALAACSDDSGDSGGAAGAGGSANGGGGSAGTSSDAGDAPDGEQPNTPVIPAQCGDMTGLQAGALWPTEGYCSANVRRSPRPFPSATSTVWTYQPAGGFEAYHAPAIDADGAVYLVAKASAAPNG